ncbi:uncharacterized protein Z519_12650 [Cladophialophora bantiana CBS 173.52]|uniref:Major facilitator superfamily (MFS) profile domain-containing protein n=1 Tax=Cladophialophora bantiana (strain ATCC 10958 / CBS 173.52 / CDC B-1940 / NIH 8579) TaxID=1442370 RepID=A0A0D2FJ57_CLAB1|nr:uncharacterized protein Z519_12650 [Cladophialophora bantiana CBS 173.52]KIW86737.1 hypothetical protein Z519_12650 [Cladophialophora bantiana CBS 173.52]
MAQNSFQILKSRDESPGSILMALGEPTCMKDLKVEDITINEATAPDAFEPETPPDGGWEAWIVVFGSFFAFMCSFGWLQCIGIFQDYYQNDLLRGMSPSSIAWISSVQSFVLYIMGVVSGKLYDSYGPRWPLLVGSFLTVLGMMMTSISKEYYQIFLSQSICWAVGLCLVFFTTAGVLGTWFKIRYPLVIAIAVCGSSLGGVIFPIMMDRIMPSLGFPWAVRIAAFLNLGLLVLVNLTVKSRIPPQPQPLRISEFTKPFAKLPFSLTVLGTCLVYFSIFLPYNYVIVQAREAGMSSTFVQYLVPIMNAASVPGRLIPGHLAIRYGGYNIFIIISTVSGVLCLALWLPAKSDAALAAFAGLYGAFGGGIFTMVSSLVIYDCPIRELGVRYGTFFMSVSFPLLAGNPVGGAIVSLEDGGYTGLKIFTGVTLLAGVFFVTAARLLITRFKVRVVI